MGGDGCGGCGGGMFRRFLLNERLGPAIPIFGSAWVAFFHSQNWA